MSEELFEAIMAHIEAVIDLRIAKEFGRDTNGLNWPVDDTRKTVRNIIFGDADE